MVASAALCLFLSSLLPHVLGKRSEFPHSEPAARWNKANIAERGVNVGWPYGSEKIRGVNIGGVRLFYYQAS